MSHVSLQKRPTFGFADPEKAQCSSTVVLQLPVAEQQNLKLKAHAPDKGCVPVLMSISTLKKMGAVIDFGRDEAVFAKLNPLKRVKLETTQTGHQVLPLTRDFMREAVSLEAPVTRLGQTASE